MTGIGLALLSSMAFAVSNIFIHLGLRGMDFFSGLLVNLLTNALLLWVFLALFAEWSNVWNPAYLLFVGVGLLVPGISRYFLFKGMERLGSSVSSALANSAPLFAIVLAFSFLNERPTPTNLLGAFLIVAGIVVLSLRGETKTWQTRDLIFPIVAAFLFGARDNLVRFGLLIIHSPILGAAIAATTSAVTIGVAYLAGSGRSRWSACSATGRRFFFLSGVMNFLSYIFMYTALQMDRVSIVSPVVNCSSLFVLPLAYFFLQDIERLTMRKITATATVVGGVLFIAWEKV